MKKMYVEIDSFDKKEINEMFNVICTDALGKTPSSVKKQMFNSKNATNDTPVSANDLLSLISANGLSMSFKVSYLKNDPKESSDVDIPPPVVTTPASQAMDNQNKEIDTSQIPNFDLG